MTMTDPIADFLTRIRNANKALHKCVEIPISKLKMEIARVLKDEGYIENYELIESQGNAILKISLKYINNKRIITNLSRVSSPGRRCYTGSKKLPKVMGGLGIAIMSTPKGILTDRQANKENVGGEVLCFVW